MRAIFPVYQFLDYFTETDEQIPLEMGYDLQRCLMEGRRISDYAFFDHPHPAVFLMGVRCGEKQ